MPANKDKKTGTWTCQFYYTNIDGERKKKCKRGFETKKEALAWENEFLKSSQADMTMTFESFIELYFQDMQHRLKESTFANKKVLIETKIIPYFGNKPLSSISAPDVRNWQNKLTSYTNKNGEPYSATYLKTINNQLCAIFNYAVRFYNLKENPCHKAGAMGKKNADEMSFWTPKEFSTFIKGLENDITYKTIFTILFFSGLRIGELLALTKNDLDFDEKAININKTYQRLNGKDLITEPKTPKSNRTVNLPDFAFDCLEQYVSRLYAVKNSDRIFPLYKNQVLRKLEIVAKETGVKKIRVHDLRHSHASLLIDMGFDALLIRDRLGHENIQTTMDTYGHLFPNKQKDVAKKIDKRFSKLLCD